MSSLFNLATVTAAGGHRLRSGYQISRSVRLRGSASAYLNRTLTTPTDPKKWTFSAWVKGSFYNGTGYTHLFGTGAAANDTSSNQFIWSGTGSTLAFSLWSINVLITNAVYRDPSAWYHVMLVMDNANATASNRAKIYVNGVEPTYSTDNRSSLSTTTNYAINSAILHTIGRWSYNSFVQPEQFDGYITEVNFIDGQALTPSSFGEINTFTGVWRPKKYVGTYGTNGFYLNFSNNSAATAAAIGADYSGNGNNWTPNNISVTAGVTFDSMLDVPTPYNDGGNGRGNYATLNPLWGTGSAGNTFADGNLKVTTDGSSSAGQTRSTIALPATGKFYCEMRPTNFVSSTSGTSRAYYGILAASSSKQIAIRTESSGSSGLTSSAIFRDDISQGSITTLSLNDILGFAIDCGAGTVQIFVNNVSVYSGSYSVTSEPYFFGFSGDSGTSDRNSVTEFNFGQRPFVYTPPTGFTALNTQNLPQPTILRGNQYFDTILWSGDGASSRAITANVGTVDFAWVKKRNGIDDNRLANSVTGGNKHLKSNATDAESTGTTVIQAFNGNTFTVGSDNSVNASGGTYVGWTWQKGATQGFDIVTYTGTGVARTISHNLGVAPKMIIVKNRSSGSFGWFVWHTAFGTAGNTDYINLNLTDAKGSGGAVSMWNTTLPTSTDFSVGTYGGVNNNTENFVAYLFAEVAGFSKFGSYTGNGAADGPFVFCGFRPAFVLVKQSSAAGNSWRLYDTARLNNEAKTPLYPNLSNAESVETNGVDCLSNGFKVRWSDGAVNTNGATYIFAAFAEAPFKNALAR
jgi:hypothetical protein